MLEKARRITKKHEFKEVFVEGMFVRGGFISLKITKRKDSSTNVNAMLRAGKDTRFGFIVGQKISKSAVVRNKVKRRLRAATESLIEMVRPGKDVIVMTVPEIVGKSSKEIKKEIEKVFKRAHLL